MSAADSTRPVRLVSGPRIRNWAPSFVAISILRAMEMAPSVPEDCIRHIRQNDGSGGSPSDAALKRLRRCVKETFRMLCAAGLIESDRFGRCGLTLTGRQVLRDHPDGLDIAALNEGMLGSPATLGPGAPGWNMP